METIAVFPPHWKIQKKYKMMRCNKCVYCRNTESLTLERLSSTFNVKLQDGGQPPAPGAEHAIGTVWFMRKPSRLRGRRWALASPFFFFPSSLSLSLSPSLSETGPARALWLRAFRRLLLKSWCSGTLSQAWAEWLFSHQWCNPAAALLGPTVATRRRSQPPAICPPQSHAPGGGGGGETQHRLHTPARSKHLKLLDNRTFPPTYKHSDYTFPHTAAALLRPQISVGPAEISVQTLPGADLTLLINWLQALLKHNISYSCSSGWMYSLKKTFRAKMNALPRLKNALLTLFPPSSSPNQNYKKNAQTLRRRWGDNWQPAICLPSDFFLYLVQVLVFF